MASAHRVVIVGGGFGGLYAARRLGSAPVSLTLIDRRNFHLFQPLLYQVATGALSPGEIASPLRAVLHKQRNTEVIMGEVRDIDVANRRLILADAEVPYDDLIIATGATHYYFGGGKGVINMKTTGKTGKVVAILSVKEDTDLVIVSQNGKIIRIEASTIRQAGRSTQGVRLVSLEEGDKVAAASVIPDTENGDAADEPASPVN